MTTKKLEQARAREKTGEDPWAVLAVRNKSSPPLPKYVVKSPVKVIPYEEPSLKEIQRLKFRSNWNYRADERFTNGTDDCRFRQRTIRTQNNYQGIW